MEYYKTR